MAEFRMPALGADMESGTLVAWKVKPGDRVKRGDLVATVETVKGAIEVEIFVDGVVDELLVTPGTVVPVGGPMARLRADAERPVAPAPGPPPVAPPPRRAPDVAGPEVFRATPLAPPLPPPTRAPDFAGPEAFRAQPAAPPIPSSARTPDVAGPEAFRAQPAAPQVSPSARTPALSGPPARATPEAPPAAPARHRASPVARRMAEELGLDLSKVQGSGPQGEVLRADVEAAAQARAAPPPPPPPSRAKVPFDVASMRKAIADTMARSKREIPHYYLGTEIELSRAMAWLEAANENRSAAERLLPAALLLKATAAALVKVPELNGTYEAGAFRPSPAVHLGVAVHLRAGGLLAPAILDAQALGVEALMARLADLVARARDGGLKATELSASTVTVTNLGELGVSTVFPVILPPQVAMVGFGKVALRPWVVDGAIGPRPVVVASLAADHRVSDGRIGARFLGALDSLLQTPEAL